MSVSEAALARRVLELRCWQLELNEDLKQGRFAVPVHLAMGHEAVAVAVDASLASGDRLVLTHRNVAYHLARARAIEPVRAAYQGRPEGLGGGELGSMNLCQPERGIEYASSILGNNLPFACGLALAGDGVVWVLTGDGAMEEGAFWEALVFARSHHLRLLFLVENNDHSLASTIGERRCEIDLSRVCAGVGVPYRAFKGNHPGQYTDWLQRLRSQAACAGPAVVEVFVKTLNNHAGPTPGWPADPRSIAIENGLVIEPGTADPAWVAEGILGREPAEAEEEECPATFSH